jgi:hypothetical protein
MARRGSTSLSSLPKATIGDNLTTMPFFTSTRARIATVTMLLSVVAASAGAQDSTRAVATPDSLASWYRDPHTAQTLGSFIPGAGHVYAGEKLRGVGLGAAALTGIASGIVFLNKNNCRLVTFGVESCDAPVSTANQISGITQIAVGAAAWVFGAIDAPRAAQRANAQARRRVAATPFLRQGVVRQAALGVAVTVGW